MVDRLRRPESDPVIDPQPWQGVLVNTKSGKALGKLALRVCASWITTQWIVCGQHSTSGWTMTRTSCQARGAPAAPPPLRSRRHTTLLTTAPSSLRTP